MKHIVLHLEMYYYYYKFDISQEYVRIMTHFLYIYIHYSKYAYTIHYKTRYFTIHIIYLLFNDYETGHLNSE